MDCQKFHKADESDKYQGVYYRDSSRGKVWWICYRKFGKLKWERVGHEADGITKVHAKELRSERQRSLRIGEILPGDQSRLSLNDAFKSYATSALADGIDLAAELSRYNQHLAPKAGNKLLQEITPQDVIELKKGWSEKGLASGTRRVIQELGSRVYNHAIRTGLWKGSPNQNPFARVTKANTSPKRERYMTEIEAQRVLEYIRAKNQKVYEAAAISLFTGLRKSEIRRLTKNNFLSNGMIRVKTKHRRLTVTRHVQIPEIARPVIESIKWTDKPYFGGKVQMDRLAMLFVRMVDELGLNSGAETITHRITFHTLRHTYGSWLALGGTPLNVIRELMGHADIGTTERYLHLVPDHKAEAMAKFSRRFTEAVQADDYPQEGIGRN